MPLVPYLIAVPLAGALVTGLVGVRLFPRVLSAFVACGAMTVAFGLSVASMFALVARPATDRVVDVTLGNWIPPLPLATSAGMGRFEIDWTLRIDPLAAVMVLLVTGVGALIHLYASVYMRDEPRPAYARFFACLNLFCALMLVLVLAGNFLVLFVGWEGVGLCSYLLIGFWYQDRTAADAGRKAFLTNRVGDWAFLIGICLVFATFGTLDFRLVGERAALQPVESGFGVVSAIALLLLAGATGKSAQAPLHVWLPDAMAGPTPVSALIHAATMVTAGVYVVARSAVLFTQAPSAMAVVAAVGAVTALAAAAVALVETDIKRVLAFSTISQVGYMFLATGLGAFAAGIFHLVTHAFFKALLFLGAGSVIHSLGGEQDMRRMGGLGSLMPVTAVTMLIGALALAGIPPLSGFVSKDEILFRAFHGNRLLWTIAIGTALLTAFYSARMMALTFRGKYRGAAGGPMPHESPRAMTGPMVVLAAATVGAGMLAVPMALGGQNRFEHFLVPSFSVSSGPIAEPAGPTQASRVALPLMVLSAAVAACGIFGARYVYLGRPGLATRVAEAGPWVATMLRRQFFVNEAYTLTVVRPLKAVSAVSAWVDDRVIDRLVERAADAVRVSAWIAGIFDRRGIDGIVTGATEGAWRASGVLRRVQTGLIQQYALAMILGLLTLLILYVWLA